QELINGDLIASARRSVYRGNHPFNLTCAFPFRRARGIVITRRWWCWLPGPVLFLLWPFSAVPLLSQQRGGNDLAHASLEDLLNIQVTSASRKEQKLSRVPAAIFVITQADIRSSGATNIPDLLR